ncbi:hypothetical protein C6P92_19895 [Burkholderia multivorans]|nr:hypothetical protein C6P92_19895 [Burkholderia multivorans]PRF25582.1 hypothetical protein C6Q03_08815 [Burkholderia multivorans]PRG36932.1 hypothetical protein C6T62_15995 [Burkholderia multivorans]
MRPSAAALRQPGAVARRHYAHSAARRSAHVGTGRAPGSTPASGTHPVASPRQYANGSKPIHLSLRIRKRGPVAAGGRRCRASSTARHRRRRARRDRPDSVTG